MATVKNIIANELLCFILNKIKKMTHDMLLKLVMDFYDDDAVFLAKSVLLDNVVLPEDDDKKRSRKGLNKKLNTMNVILNVFLIMTLEEIPLFVARILLIYGLFPRTTLICPALSEIWRLLKIK